MGTLKLNKKSERLTPPPARHLSERTQQARRFKVEDRAWQLAQTTPGLTWDKAIELAEKQVP